MKIDTVNYGLVLTRKYRASVLGLHELEMCFVIGVRKK